MNRKLERSWRKSETEKAIWLHTVEQTDTVNLDVEEKITPEKLDKLIQDTGHNIAKATIDRDTLKKRLAALPPKDYNLEPRLEKLRDDIEKINKYIQADNAKKQWDGMIQELKIVEETIDRAEKDIKDLNEMRKLL